MLINTSKQIKQNIHWLLCSEAYDSFVYRLCSNILEQNMSDTSSSKLICGLYVVRRLNLSVIMLLILRWWDEENWLYSSHPPLITQWVPLCLMTTEAESIVRDQIDLLKRWWVWPILCVHKYMVCNLAFPLVLSPTHVKTNNCVYVFHYTPCACSRQILHSKFYNVQVGKCIWYFRTCIDVGIVIFSNNMCSTFISASSLYPVSEY